MKISQLRNATVLVEIGPHRLLVDPMLAKQGALPSLKWFTPRRRRNPLVDLPPQAPGLLDTATRALITHCRKGHFDHLDRAGIRWLRERQLPVLCMPEDAEHLRRRGLAVEALAAEGTSTVDGLRISPVPCLHGEGWMLGRLMAHGHGYLIEHPGEPSLYIAGDTVLTDDVRRCVTDRRPAVSIVPAGGAAFDLGGELIMDGAQALALALAGDGVFIANHLEALDHCPTRRDSLRAQAATRGLGARFLVPEDGDTMCFDAGRTDTSPAGEHCGARRPPATPALDTIGLP
ncbi:MBL fold metallo-hydrolase [Aquabacterium humicola]|uniref:MBL fold metallo-hydrolase n=1 Tax=Aquabacterium humicola TaxID=3237377 RepID=UPI002542AA7E|nr:MBL fold metallo-hydrolase [Rubrivivax pictus]